MAIVDTLVIFAIKGIALQLVFQLRSIQPCDLVCQGRKRQATHATQQAIGLNPQKYAKMVSPNAIITSQLCSADVGPMCYADLDVYRGYPGDLFGR